MSQGRTAALRNTSTLSKSKQSHSHIVAQLDEQLQHLSDTILPPYPYLLSVPSDVPYRHSARFVNTWYEGTPFDRQEEQLQYLSFLPHLGEHESLLKVEGGWADDHGNPVEEEELSPKALPVSGRQTPAELGQRKKISLKDYKTKGKSPPAPTPQLQSPKTADKPAPAPVEAKTENAEMPQASTEKKQEDRPAPAKSDTIRELPAKATHMDGAKSPQVQPKVQQTESPSPAKRRKLSPPFEGSNPVAKAPKPEQQPFPLKMPRLLSPTLPSPEKGIGMPQLLSPLLPPSLAKELSTPPHTISVESPASGQPKRSDPVRSILAGADLDNGIFGDKNALAPGGNRVRSDSQHSARSSAPETPNAAKALLAKNGVRSGTPLHNGIRASPGPRQRHTIILKYGKKNRKRVEALLKFATRHKKEPLKHEPAASRNIPEVNPRKDAVKKEALESRSTPEVKSKAATVDDIKLEKKRKPEDSPAPSVKKIKAVEVEKRPTTPVPPPAKTPLTSQPRSTFSTPKKELKSTAMRRVESTDNGDAPTPTGDKARISTPQPAPKPSPQPPSGTSSSRQEERQQWININDRFFALGRKLKHEGTAMLPPPESDSKSPKAALFLVEALLCFMINLAANSNARPNTDPGWRSIVLYHIFVFRASRKFPHLHALVVQLGAVCRQLVHKYDMEKLARDPLPDDYCNSAPTPGSDGNTKTNEDAEKYKKRYVDFRDDLIENARELQIAWLESSRQMPPEILKRDYPITWSKRAKDSSLRLQEKPTPSNIARDFYLPLDASTTPLEAARFGVTFMEEWAEKEKVSWKTKIDL